MIGFAEVDSNLLPVKEDLYQLHTNFYEAAGL